MDSSGHSRGSGGSGSRSKSPRNTKGLVGMRVGSFDGLDRRRGTASRNDVASPNAMKIMIGFMLFTLVGCLYVFGSIVSRGDGAQFISELSDSANTVMFGLSATDISTPFDYNNNNANNYNNNKRTSSLITADKKIISPSTPGWTTRPNKPVTIGYAISIIKCNDKQSNIQGMIDAALILRHSIDMIHNEDVYSNNNYNYKMYAFVHTNAKECAKQPLEQIGYTVLVKDNPIERDEIEGTYLRDHIQIEWCCGEDEFIKLYSYKLNDVPIVVHVDIDFIFYKPMDDIYDAMLYSKDSEIGQLARKQIPVEFPNELKWPDVIDAFMTRDWPQVMPERKAGFQAGLLIIKPNEQVFDLIIDVIRKGDYVDGFGRDNGWGGKGYGAFVGAMAMQGLLAYVYDEILYDSWVELNQCRFNHIGMDVLYRNQPSFRPKHEKVGKCRNDRDYCEDCMVTKTSDIYNIHYNQCRKPWNCIGEGNKSGKDKDYVGKEAIPEDQVNLDHCLDLLKIWHDTRTDLEAKLLLLPDIESASIKDAQSGDYKNDFFQGHCKGYGDENYLPLSENTKTLQRIPDLYK